MSRILAIDYGTKRVGIAVTDELQLIASGLTTVKTSEAIDFIVKYIEQHQVKTIVVGDPKRMNNTPSSVAEEANKFVKLLNKKISNISIVRIDERFTSKMAFQTMIDSGLKKKARRNKELIDEISATIILQSYLEQFS